MSNKSYGIDKTKEILRRADYSPIREHVINLRKTEGRDEMHLEWWAGKKGVIILQWYGEGPDGVMTFADWPTGIRFDQLEAIL